MTTIQVRVDDELKKEAYQVFEKMNLSPSRCHKIISTLCF